MTTMHSKSKHSIRTGTAGRRGLLYRFSAVTAVLPSKAAESSPSQTRSCRPRWVRVCDARLDGPYFVTGT